MVLKSTTVLLAFASLFAGSIATPVPADTTPSTPSTPTSPTGDDLVWYVWSDTSRCDESLQLDVTIVEKTNTPVKDDTETEGSTTPKSKRSGENVPPPGVVGKQLPTGELLFTLHAPFTGTYTITSKSDSKGDPPSVEIEIYEKDKKPAAKATYIPGTIGAEFDTLSWTPDSFLKTQKVIKPDIEKGPNPQLSVGANTPTTTTVDLNTNSNPQGDYIETFTFPDALWLVWCSGEVERIAKTNLVPNE